MARAGSGVVIDINRLDQQWLSSLKRRVEGARLRRNHGDQPRTISRVPLNMREGDPVAYEPRIISFGPFCRDNPALKPMEQLKLRYVQRLLRRNPNAALEDYVNLIRDLEVRSRACYSEDIFMESHQFVEMMLLDGCFLVEFLLINFNDGGSGSAGNEDYPVLTTYTLYLIKYDMLLLQNQIPFFIIEGVFKLAYPDSLSLTDLLLRFFKFVFPSERMSSPPDTFHHILHFLHSGIIPFKSFSTLPAPPPSPIAPSSPPTTAPPSLATRVHRAVHACVSNSMAPIYVELRKISWLLPDISLRTPESVPCATMLMEAGVKFREKKADSFLEVAFHNGTMEIPTLRLYDETNSLFRNLIAFEQCFPEVGTHVVTYAGFMDCLIDSREDVALLCRHGCIMNWLGSDEEAARLFNRLCKEVLVDNDSGYLASVFRDVKKHCDSRWHMYRAMLMRDYFSNPWSFFSLLGALIIILLTGVQALFAILTYSNPPPTS